MRRALQTIYREDFGGGDIEPELFRAVFGPLSSAIDDAFPGIPERDEAFVDALRHSAEVFSAFKVHRAQSDMRDRLLDSDGNLKSFEQWSNDVRPIASHQFGPWLRTEYDTAVIRAQNAADWRRFEQYRDVLPNLRWVPSTSANPGADHLPYWGTVLPIDHPFWSHHHPGDRWNCKCSLDATDDEPTGVPENPDAKPLQPQRGLEGNPGKSGKLFDLKHPYFPDSCSECPFNRGFKNRVTTLFAKQKDCSKCQQVDKVLPIDLAKKKENKEFYEASRRNPDISHTFYDEASGGMIAIDRRHKGGLPNKGRDFVYSETWYRKQIEKRMSDKANNGHAAEILVALWFAKRGHRVQFMPEGQKDNKGNEKSAIDMIVDGVKMDIKTVFGQSDYVRFLTKKNKQLLKYNNRADTIIKANALCIYFINGDYNHQEMASNIATLKQKFAAPGKTLYLEQLYIVVEGNDSLINIEI